MHIEKTNSMVKSLLALPLLRDLDSLYPGFEYWYVNQVIPGAVIGTDTVLLAMDHTRIIGVALGKRSEQETKLRCIRVLPEYQQRGIGLKLIDAMLDELQDEKPHCTVAEEMMHTYSRAFINRYGFELNSVDKGRYRKGKLEYAFN